MAAAGVRTGTSRLDGSGRSWDGSMRPVDLFDAKADAEVSGVRPALAYPNVTLLTNAQAVRLETSGSAVDGVVVEQGDGRVPATHRAGG